MTNAGGGEGPPRRGAPGDGRTIFQPGRPIAPPPAPVLPPAPAPPPAPAQLPFPPPPPPDQSPPPRELSAPPADMPARSHGLLIAGGAVVLMLLLAGSLWFVWSREDSPAPVTEQTSVRSEAIPASAPPSGAMAAARTALDLGLPSIACTWLDIASIGDSGGGVAIALRGVAGNPAEAQGQVARMLAGRSINVASIAFEDVSPIRPSECGPLEAFRQIRGPGGGRLSVAQRQFEMARQSEPGPEATGQASGEPSGEPGAAPGKPAATAIIEIDLAGAVPDAALFGLEESGDITPILPQRADFDQEGVEKLPGGRYRLPLTTTHEGWSGVLLLTGKGPFDTGLIGGTAGSRGADWPRRFLDLARQRGWRAEMVWYKTVDQQPN